MNRNSLGVSAAGTGAERSRGERSEPQRSGASVPAAALPAASRPDPEVVARPQRRSYTAEYKGRILREAEAAAATRGGVGALLRREGLYSSLLVYWRRERVQGIREALTPQKRGPKSKRPPLADEMEKLQRKNARLSEQLRKAHIIIDVKKSGRTVGSSACGPRSGEGILMAAVTELAAAVGTRAGCFALWVSRGSYYRDRRSSSSPVQTAPRPRSGQRLGCGGTGNHLDLSSPGTFPGSLARRRLCDLAR